jgi:hypothetical protein
MVAAIEKVLLPSRLRTDRVSVRIPFVAHHDSRTLPQFSEMAMMEQVQAFRDIRFESDGLEKVAGAPFVPKKVPP